MAKTFPPLVRRTKRRSYTRQGAIARAQRLPRSNLLSPIRMAAYLFSGSLLIGLGVSFLVHARLGLPPYDVMLSAIKIHTGMSHGQAAWVAAAVLFSVAALLGRPPKPAGLVLAFLNGFSVDLASSLLVDPESMAMRILFVVLGTTGIAAGISLVISSGTTGGAFELLMEAGGDRGLRPARVRTVLEAAVIIGGVAAGGTAGLATVGFALTIGPLLNVTGQALDDHRRGRQLRQDGAASSATTSELLLPAARE